MKLPPLPKFKLNMISLLNLMGLVVIIYLVVILGQTVMKNYALNKQIDDLKTQMTRLQDQKDTLAYNIQYYKTDSYQQREARAKLGLQLPGEVVVALPSPTVTATPAPAVDAKAAKKKSNYSQWLDFLGGNG
jgi:cell division protein FtsB